MYCAKHLWVEMVLTCPSSRLTVKSMFAEVLDTYGTWAPIQLIGLSAVKTSTVKTKVQLLENSYLCLLDKPEVRSRRSCPYTVKEEQTATLMCIVTDANPNTGITWRWIRADSPNVIFHTGPNFTISNIQREISGSFNCTASNSVGTSEAAVLIVDVQCVYIIFIIICEKHGFVNSFDFYNEITIKGLR